MKRILRSQGCIFVSVDLAITKCRCRQVVAIQKPSRMLCLPLNTPALSRTILFPLRSCHHSIGIIDGRTLRLAINRSLFAPSRPPFRTHLHRAFMSSPAVLAAQAALASIDLSTYDPEQSRLMDEKCILVDEQDNAIGAVDKKTCRYSVPSRSSNSDLW